MGTEEPEGKNEMIEHTMLLMGGHLTAILILALIALAFGVTWWLGCLRRIWFKRIH